VLYPAYYDFPPILRGFDWDWVFTFEVGGEPLDLTDYTMNVELLETWDSTESLLTLTSADGITLGDDGSVTMEISAADTEALLAGRRYVIVSLTDPDGKTYAIIQGRWPVVSRGDVE
jgi:hypothetical protein